MLVVHLEDGNAMHQDAVCSKHKGHKRINSIDEAYA